MQNSSSGLPAEDAHWRRRWFLVNFGILYGIAFAAACAAVLLQPGEVGSALSWDLPLLGAAGLVLTCVFTFPAFLLYLVCLRLARRRWARRSTAWILTPLLTWAVVWTWPAEGQSSWWNFSLALASVAAAAALVRV